MILHHFRRPPKKQVAVAAQTPNFGHAQIQGEMNPVQAVIECADPGQTTPDEVAWLDENLLAPDERDAVRRFVFARDRHDRIAPRASFSTELNETSERWQFHLNQTRPRHVLATALEIENGRQKEIILRHWRIGASEDWIRVTPGTSA